MQSGYGPGVSEMQQFLVDGCTPPLFSITPPPTNPTPTDTDMHGPGADAQAPIKYHHPHLPHPHPHHHHHHHHTPQQHHLQQQSHFPHFQPIPITQQLFQQTHHQFQLFHYHPHPHQHHHHQLGHDKDSGPENSSSPSRMTGNGGGGDAAARGSSPPTSFLAAAMNFRLAVNDGSGGDSRDGLKDNDAILREPDSPTQFHWLQQQQQQQHQQREEEPSIKEPFWRPMDLDSMNRKRYKDKEPETSTNAYAKKRKEAGEPGQGHPTSGSNYKLFSELEAICKPGGATGGGGVTGNNQTGSGSALTGDEAPLVAAPVPDEPAPEHGSDTSTGGGEAPRSIKLPARRKRKRRAQQMSSIAVFFEGLVKQLMSHQESLHRKFLEAMEARDRERTSREEAWRAKEAAKAKREAAERAHERALAATREAAIISFLEKITGETLNLPTKAQFQFQSQSQTQTQDEPPTDDPIATTAMESGDAMYNNNSNTDSKLQLSSSRWPRAEVQALIRVRSGLESRFQEPGLKGPLWEEVSTMMTSLGYYRSAKRCKEKWENINKYFRKTKDSGKKRPQHSKTCPYFQQLDQLYSKSHKKALPPCPSPPNTNAAASSDRVAATQRDNSELLDAIVVSTDHPTNFNFPEMRSLGINYNNGEQGDAAEAEGGAMPVKGSNGDEEDDEIDRDGDEGEGESQGQWPEQQQHLQCLHS